MLHAVTGTSSAVRRLVAFEDSTYHRLDGTIYADRAFLTFLAGLSKQFDALLLLGRLSPVPGTSHYPLGDGVRFVALPHYPDLLHLWPVVKALAGSARRVWTTLGEADAAFVLGPTPMSIMITMLALLRRKRVVLGVRQNTAQYARNRHPGRRSVHLVADMLEFTWRALAHRCPVAVVGKEVADRYAFAPRRYELYVSLVREQDIAGETAASSRDYSDEVLVLSVGRLEPEKNPRMLADVLATLRRRGGQHRLVVCGEGPLRDELASRLEALGVADCAELRGYVPIDALMELYRHCHLLLHVSWTEGVPQILYEAFAARLPVVATDVGGVRAAAGDASLLIPPGDAMAAARAIEEVTSDTALRARMIDGGVRRVTQHTFEAEQRRLASFIRGEASGAR